MSATTALTTSAAAAAMPFTMMTTAITTTSHQLIQKSFHQPCHSMSSELANAADVVVVAVVIIVKGMAAVTADVVRAVVALMPKIDSVRL